MPLEHITSAANPRLKLLRRLHARRTRLREGCFAVEGEDLVAAGLAAGLVPRWVIGDSEALFRDGGADAQAVLAQAAAAGAECATAEPALLSADSQLAHHARLVAVFDLPAAEPDTLPDGVPVLLLDGVRDPGNVGTLARTALMFGVEHVVLGTGTADPYGPKASRASMGAIFHSTFIRIPDLAAELGTAAAAGRQIAGLAPGASERLAEAALAADAVLCIGSERDGLSVQVADATTALLAIDQAADHAGRPDSLNAAMAGGIVLYEWSRTHRASAAAPTASDA